MGGIREIAALAAVLMIIGFVMAIFGIFYLWWGARFNYYPVRCYRRHRIDCHYNKYGYSKVQIRRN